METRIITEVLTNWIKIKDLIPNSNYQIKDPLYLLKMTLLLKGHETLGNYTYQEWSNHVEAHCLRTVVAALTAGSNIETDAVSDYGRDYLSDYARDVMFDICWQAQQVSSPTDEQQRKAFINDALYVCDRAEQENSAINRDLNNIVIKSIDSILRLLGDFPSQYLLDVMDDSNKYVHDEDEQEHWVAQGAIHIITEFFPKTMKDLATGGFEELAELCDLTFNHLMLGRYNASDKSKVKQNREAALKRNEPARKTREYAIKLYEEKTWKSTRFASRSIENQVMLFGIQEAEFDFKTDEPYNTIYEWLRKHNKNK